MSNDNTATPAATGERHKVGMYGEMPVITIGKYTIAMMTDKPNEDRVWIQEEDQEGGEFPASMLEPVIQEFFDKNF